MSMYGANPEQLAALGRSLKAQTAAIDAVVSTVAGAFGATVWEGPARQQFENDWNSVFRTTLNRLNEAFERAGSDCINRSAELQRVMG